MSVLTAKILAAACGCSAATAQKWVGPLINAMSRYGIDTPKRQAAFLAQIAHESGRFVYVREIWGPTKAQQGYEGRRDLGNDKPGDGKRFMGRGLIQITGRANYEAVGKALGLNLLVNPELLEEPELAALSAAWFWDARGLNELADADQFRTITRRINGGLNGYDERVALWKSARNALNTPA